MDPQAREQLADLLLTWEDRFHEGVDLSAEELAIDHPELIEPLARRIRVLRETTWLNTSEDLATADESDSPSEAGRVLCGRYRLEERVAVGGFAEVWRADDMQLSRAVAVKIPLGTRADAPGMFLAEARSVARLRHPSIVSIHDVGTDEGDIFIVTAFLDGGTLADRLADGPIARERGIRWFVQIAHALDYAHRHGVVHCDVKPANILIDHHGNAVLADFGIAQWVKDAATHASTVGTLRYMAPEQLSGEAVGAAADIYSLGTVLHEALTGLPPYAGKTPSAIRDAILGSRTPPIAESLPRDLAGVCRRAIQHAPTARFRTAAAFADALRATERGRSSARWKSWLAIAAAVGALGVFFAPRFHAGPENQEQPVIRGQATVLRRPPQPIKPANGRAPMLTPSAGERVVTRTFFRILEALPYVVDVHGVSLYREWQSPPDTYLGPTTNAVEGAVTFRFDYPAPVTAARLTAEAMCWDFSKQEGGAGRGAAAVDVSVDNATWVTLRDTIGMRAWGKSWVFDERLEPPLLDAKTLFVRIRLLSEEAPTEVYNVAQFGRNRPEDVRPTFAIEATLAEDFNGSSPEAR